MKILKKEKKKGKVFFSNASLVTIAQKYII